MAAQLGAGGRLLKRKASIVELLWYVAMQRDQYENTTHIEKMINTQNERNIVNGHKRFQCQSNDYWQKQTRDKAQLPRWKLQLLLG